MISTATSAPSRTFLETITAAVNDFAANGYDSEQRLEYWLAEIGAAAARDMLPEAEVEREMRGALQGIYTRLVDHGGLLKQQPGASRFTISQVRPQLRAELDRRILASASLIKLNRAEAMAQTLQRFAGWATSVPPGGSNEVDRVATKRAIRKSLASMSFEDRRRNTDQGHKFAANLADIFAHDGGAIAGIWHQHYTRYPRETHRARDGKVYALRGNWALARGLMRAGPAGYLDDITQAGEEVSCRCTVEYLYGLGQLPAAMLTVKGSDELARVRREIAA